MPDEQIAVPLEELVAALAKLVKGAEATDVILFGERIEYTLDTLIGEVRIAFSADGMKKLLTIMNWKKVL